MEPINSWGRSQWEKSSLGRELSPRATAIHEKLNALLVHLPRMTEASPKEKLKTTQEDWESDKPLEKKERRRSMTSLMAISKKEVTEIPSSSKKEWLPFGRSKFLYKRRSTLLSTVETTEEKKQAELALLQKGLDQVSGVAWESIAKELKSELLALVFETIDCLLGYHCLYLEQRCCSLKGYLEALPIQSPEKKALLKKIALLEALQLREAFPSELPAEELLMRLPLSHAKKLTAEETKCGTITIEQLLYGHLLWMPSKELIGLVERALFDPSVPLFHKERLLELCLCWIKKASWKKSVEAEGVLPNLLALGEAVLMKGAACCFALAKNLSDSCKQGPGLASLRIAALTIHKRRSMVPGEEKSKAATWLAQASRRIVHDKKNEGLGETGQLIAKYEWFRSHAVQRFLKVPWHQLLIKASGSNPSKNKLRELEELIDLSNRVSGTVALDLLDEKTVLSRSLETLRKKAIFYFHITRIASQRGDFFNLMAIFSTLQLSLFNEEIDPSKLRLSSEEKEQWHKFTEMIDPTGNGAKLRKSQHHFFHQQQPLIPDISYLLKDLTICREVGLKKLSSPERFADQQRGDDPFCLEQISQVASFFEECQLRLRQEEGIFLDDPLSALFEEPPLAKIQQELYDRRDLMRGFSAARKERSMDRDLPPLLLSTSMKVLFIGGEERWRSSSDGALSLRSMDRSSLLSSPRWQPVVSLPVISRQLVEVYEWLLSKPSEKFYFRTPFASPIAVQPADRLHRGEVSRRESFKIIASSLSFHLATGHQFIVGKDHVLSLHQLIQLLCTELLFSPNSLGKPKQLNRVANWLISDDLAERKRVEKLIDSWLKEEVPQVRQQLLWSCGELGSMRSWLFVLHDSSPWLPEELASWLISPHEFLAGVHSSPQKPLEVIETILRLIEETKGETPIGHKASLLQLTLDWMELRMEQLPKGGREKALHLLSLLHRHSAFQDAGDQLLPLVNALRQKVSWLETVHKPPVHVSSSTAFKRSQTTPGLDESQEALTFYLSSCCSPEEMAKLMNRYVSAQWIQLGSSAWPSSITSEANPSLFCTFEQMARELFAYAVERLVGSVEGTDRLAFSPQLFVERWEFLRSWLACSIELGDLFTAEVLAELLQHPQVQPLLQFLDERALLPFALPQLLPFSLRDWHDALERETAASFLPPLTLLWYWREKSCQPCRSVKELRAHIAFLHSFGALIERATSKSNKEPAMTLLMTSPRSEEEVEKLLRNFVDEAMAQLLSSSL